MNTENEKVVRDPITEALIEARAELEFHGVGNCRAVWLIDAALQSQVSNTPQDGFRPDWMNYSAGYRDGVDAIADDLKQLCKDFSDLRDRPYMGDVTAQIDALVERCKSEVPTPPQQEQSGEACKCHRCIEENDLRDESGLPLSSTRMILCPICGNKRCPHASDHDLACTGSNEPGQEGSVYSTPTPTSDQAGAQEAVAWRDVVGYEGIYQVSSDGDIRSVDTGRILSKNLAGKGYVKASLWSNGIRTQTYVHRVVAMAFLGLTDESGNQVNHKNGIKTDNRVSNLEVVTCSENILHSYYELGNLVRPITATNVITGEKTEYRSVEEAVKIGGFNSGHIYSCLNGNRKTHLSHTFANTSAAPPTSTAIAAMVIKQAAEACRGRARTLPVTAAVEAEKCAHTILALIPANAEAELEALMMKVADIVSDHCYEEFIEKNKPVDIDDLLAIVRRVLVEKGG